MGHFRKELCMTRWPGNQIKGRKYGNKKIVAGGLTFDSKKEFTRYCELRLLEKAGKIQDLQMQVKYVLIPTQYEPIPRYSQKTGKRLKDKEVCIEQECAYIADFVYKENGTLVVEDTKSEPTKTRTYKLKKRLLFEKYGIEIKEITNKGC